MKQEREAINWR